MSLITRNQLKCTYEEYQLSQLKKTVEQIPVERRAELAEEIAARARLLGCRGQKILESAVQALKEGNGNKQNGQNVF